MGFDIGSQDYQNRDVNTPPNVQGERLSEENPKTPLPSRLTPNLQDQLTTVLGGPKGEQTTDLSQHSPQLITPEKSLDNLGGHINDTIEKLDLPKGKDISDKLSEKMQEKIKELLNSFEEKAPYAIDLKQFFNLLSKLYPLSLSLLTAMLKSEGKTFDFYKNTQKKLTDIGKILKSFANAKNLPEQLKTKLVAISENLSQAKTPKEIEELFKEVQNFSNHMDLYSTENRMKKAESFLEQLKKQADTKEFDSKEVFNALKSSGLLTDKMLKKETVEMKDLKALLENPALDKNIKASFKSIKALLQQGLDLLTLLHTAKFFAKEGQKFALNSLLVSPTGQTPEKPQLVGLKLEELSNQFGKSFHKIVSTAYAKPSLEPSDYASNTAFKLAILTGAILGNALVKSTRELSEEGIAFAQLKLNMVKELKIVDQIPFSLLAFFPDISQDSDDDDGAACQAKIALLQLIRLMLKLVFVLSALASCGEKMGDKGAKQMLQENSLFLITLLDDVTFALKKVDEHYVVSVSYQLALLQQAKDGLVAKEFGRFWDPILHFFNPKTELSAFLEGIEDAKPLFITIKALMEGDKRSLSADMPL